jgi:predicted DNA-binding protein (MmcQ/YjbR family)
VAQRYWPPRHDPDDPLWQDLWDHLGGLPDTHQEPTWGLLTFRVGRKLFGVCRGGVDGIVPSVTFKPNPGERPYLEHDSRFYLAPYFKPWLTLDLTGPADLPEAAELLVESYLQVAPKALAKQVATRFAGTPAEVPDAGQGR